MRREDGGVLVLVALVLPVVTLLMAGAFSSFVLVASDRELQGAADRSALAAAAAIPPLQPAQLEAATYPLPGTSELEALGVPRMGDLVPDPRTVACSTGAEAFRTSARMTSAFRDPWTPDAGTCPDGRVVPSFVSEDTCTDELVARVVSLGLPLPVAVDLDALAPALLTPAVQVTVTERLRPPLVSLLGGPPSGAKTAEATARRRIKNAVVVPILPSQTLLPTDDVLLNPYNLNLALHASQQQLLAVLDDADARLRTLASTLGLPCGDLLGSLRGDLGDVYDPPTGAAPSAFDIVRTSVRAAGRAATRAGAAEPDPSDPDSLAGEAFWLIGVSATDAMGPVAATQIPVLDAALVVLREVSRATCDTAEPAPLLLSYPKLPAGECYRAAEVAAASARGAFRASLER